MWKAAKLAPSEQEQRRGDVISRARTNGPRGSHEQDRQSLLTGGLGYLLARAGGMAVRDLNRALQSYGLRSRHFTVLAVAAESTDRSQRELGELLGIDPSAVVAIVDDLAREGLVRRDPDPDDRRTRLVVVTEAGHARLVHLRALARAVDDDLQAELTPDEQGLLLDLLRRIVGH